MIRDFSEELDGGLGGDGDDDDDDDEEKEEDNAAMDYYRHGQGVLRGAREAEGSSFYSRVPDGGVVGGGGDRSSGGGGGRVCASKTASPLDGLCVANLNNYWSAKALCESAG